MVHQDHGVSKDLKVNVVPLERQDKREIRDHLDRREAVVWLSLDHLEKEDNVDPPDLTDPLEKITFPEVTKSHPSRKVDQEHQDPRERKETSVVTVHQDKRESRVSTVKMDQRESLASEDLEVNPEETVSKVMQERKETKENVVQMDQSDLKEKSDQRVSQDLQDNPVPRDLKETQDAKAPKDKRVCKGQLVLTEHHAKQFQEIREPREHLDQEVTQASRENQDRTSSTMVPKPLRRRRVMMVPEVQAEIRGLRESPDTEGTEWLELVERWEIQV